MRSASSRRTGSTRVVQCNISFNREPRHAARDALSGAPHGEAKLVRCTRGAVYDVVVDLRPDSPTFREHVGVELTRRQPGALYIPDGFAHGFQTLEDDTEVLYQMSEFYAPSAAAASAGTIPPSGSRGRSTDPIIERERDRDFPGLRSPRGAGRTRRTAAGEAMHALIAELYPDLPQHHRRWRARDPRRLQASIPLEIHEVPTGTRCSTGRCRGSGTSATPTIENARGERVVDFRQSNLHVVNYSVPVRARCRSPS